MTLARLRSAILPRRRQTAPRDIGARKAAARRKLGWATLAAFVLGLLGLVQPLDDYLRMLRSQTRMHAPSGKVVIIGIDDHSVERLGAWPWNRERHAQIIERANAAGAKRIFFDIFFNSPTTKKADQRLAGALKAAGNVHLAVGVNRDLVTGELRPKFPREEFRAHANLVSVATNYSGYAWVRSYPYGRSLGGVAVASLPAKLANVNGPIDTNFPIDYSIDFGKVAKYSASDLIEGRVPPAALRDKDVVVGVTSLEMGDIFFLPGRGVVNGIYIAVAGGETLRQGNPLYLGWFLPLLVGFALSAAHVFAKRRWFGRIALAVGAIGMIVLPRWAEARFVIFDTMPSLFLIVSVGISQAWANFRQSYKVRGNINAMSGLPNLNALRDESAAIGAVLVGARVRNFAEISSSLPPEGERALVEQIVARLALGARGARIHQGDEGIFVWSSTVDVAGPDQLDALHALFRSPALVDGRPIDLSVTFGIDADDNRTLANRIGATLVAADEAAVEGLRWKTYDPAKLADAEWKLSLLGRLDSAIDTGEIWVAYQPQLDVRSGRLSGAEALVRWSHPDKGEISPMEFVLAAEQHNRIDKLTAFVLDDAIRAAADFHARGIAFDVAVNISARLLEKPGLVPMVREMLRESGLPPERLTLEVTESAALTSDRTSIRTLEEIGSLGINVSIDDYGTGYSTLEYFKRIPATEVKIDKSFVGAIDRNASDRLMVQSTIELAHSLGRSVVAEGVETQEVLAELTNLGCDKIQGYLIGRPMKLVNLTKLIREEQATRAA